MAVIMAANSNRHAARRRMSEHEAKASEREHPRMSLKGTCARPLHRETTSYGYSSHSGFGVQKSVGRIVDRAARMRVTSHEGHAT